MPLCLPLSQRRSTPRRAIQYPCPPGRDPAVTVRAIVFDFGNVISFFQRRRAAANLAAFGPPGLDPARIVPLLAHPEYEALYETDRMTSAQILALLRKELQLTGDDDQLAFAFADMFEPN